MKKKRYCEATERFFTIYNHEQPARFRRHYFELVVDALKSLHLRYLPRQLNPDQLIDRVHKVFDELPWTQKESARLYLLLSKAYQKLKNPGKARSFLDRSLEADPDFTQAKRWQVEM